MNGYGRGHEHQGGWGHDGYNEHGIGYPGYFGQNYYPTNSFYPQYGWGYPYHHHHHHHHYYQW
ncbi:Spore coat protein YeeK (fragment) [Candidatus Desulfosporosinus infrequens]|uniref:Spore coat protein YeeK n=1 Tax=Candidatus Desulfosporosinus infrequens TaxID=2043169 RepID=A0A2U3LFF7_9FIRM